MGTKSRETIYGASVRAAAERAAEARKEADRLAVSWRLVANLRRPASGPPGSIDLVTEQSPEVSVNNVNSRIQRVVGASIRDIENLISELESLHDLLQAEGMRMQREISGYAQLSQAAMKSTRRAVERLS